MESLVYTGTNFEEVKRFCGDKVLAPYICMGFSMLSLDTPDGLITIHEGDTILRDPAGNFFKSTTKGL